MRIARHSERPVLPSRPARLSRELDIALGVKRDIEAVTGAIPALTDQGRHAQGGASRICALIESSRGFPLLPIITVV